MATSLVSTGVQFPDSTIQTTAAAAGGTVTATASGAITAGNGVTINSNGTVSAPVITLSTSVAAQQTAGNDIQQNDTMSLAFYPVLNVYVLTYINTSNYLSGKVGAPSSDGSITWSAATVLYTGNTASYPNTIYYESQQQMVVVMGVGTSLSALALTVTSTSVTAAASLVGAESGMSGGRVKAAYDPTADRVACVYIDPSSAGGRVRVMALSGTTITFPGGDTGAGLWYEPSIFYFPPAGKCVVFARFGSNYLTGFLLSISGSSVPSLGTAQTLSTSYQGVGDQPGFAYSPAAAKAVMGFFNSSTYANQAYGVLTISGTTLTLNNITVNANVAYSQFAEITYDTKTDKFVWFSRATSTTYFQLQVGTLSGTTVSWGTPTVISSEGSGTSNKWSAAYDPVNLRSGVVYQNYGTTRSNTVSTGTSSLTADNFLGISNSTVANGASATIAIVGGVNSNQSGLTPGTKYYLEPSGPLTTTAGAIYAGLALSATSILVKG